MEEALSMCDTFLQRANGDRRTDHEFGRPLDVVYINLKDAFDSVDSAALWKSLERIVTPAAILDILCDLHTHTT